MLRLHCALIVGLAALGMTAVQPCAAAEPACAPLGPRVACGGKATTQASCEEMGCCWSAEPLATEDWQPDVYLPPCFTPNAGDSAYKLKGGDLMGDGKTGKATLTNTSFTQPELGADIARASVELEEISHGIVRLKIDDANKTAERWEPPAEFFQKDSVLSGARLQGSGKPREWDVAVEADPFSFAVLRVDGQTGDHKGTTFNSSSLRLVFKDQYIELSTWVNPDAVIFGGGERSSETTYMTRNGYPYTLWNRDQNPQVPMRNTYGAWPFILVLEADGSAWGALLHNSNAMDMVATEDRLSWRSTGGVIDLYVFVGPSPLDVIDQYTQVVGRPAMQPYWSFGFHQSKYGYQSVWEVRDVVANYSDAKIPLETIWVDIDHMDEYRVFSFSPEFFPINAFQDFVASLKKSGQKWVPILDPGIKTDNAFAPYTDGVHDDVYIKDVFGDDYLGWVWPGACVFPDFGFNPRADRYWERQLDIYHSYAQYSGLWIDMNEIANFCTGEVCMAPGPQAIKNQQGFQQWMCQLMCYYSDESGLSPDQMRYTNPPYQVANSLDRSPLNFKAISPLATHHGGVIDYNAHNLYGLVESRATKAAMEKIKKERPFILTRSTYVGTGAYAAHWLGDNAATWNDLQWSIPGCIASGMAGIPMVGADICGFAMNTTEELCGRWIELGAWYPFARDHSDKAGGYQELYRWASVADAGRRVLNLRQRLLPLFYTLNHDATQSGAPMLRALWMNFPSDAQTHANSRQFMLGDSILVSPVLEEGGEEVEAYFPRGLWYDIWKEGRSVVDKRSGGGSRTIKAPLGSGAPAHIRGGSVLPMQREALTTDEVKASPLTLVVALPELVGGDASPGTNGSLKASGHMFNDDGLSVEVPSSCCNVLSFDASVDEAGKSSLLLRFGKSDSQQCDGSSSGDAKWPELEAVRVLGWQGGVSAPSVEVLQGADGKVLSSHKLRGKQVKTDGHQATLDLGGAGVTLECPNSVRITWAAAQAQ